MKLVFLGDSITDVGRNTNNGSMASLGQGYPLLVTSEILAREPGKHTFINTGVSGSKITDISARIKKDCWNNQADAISILIGVNDVWHEIFDQNGVEPERFERIFDDVLNDTEKRLPNIKMIILEPFVLKGSATEENWERFYSEVKEIAAAVKRVANKHNAVFIPLQEKLEKASEEMGPSYWLADGVHPSPAGHRLIADEWLKAFKQIEG